MWVLNRYVERGIDPHTGYIDIVKAQTPETIAAFARQILAAGNKVEVVMTPAE
jgi:zinc protease